MALIHADLDKVEKKTALTEGKISPLEPAPQLTVEDIDATTNNVGQMGNEPIMKALDSGVQVVLAGRAYDPTVFAAPAIRKGMIKALRFIWVKFSSALRFVLILAAVLTACLVIWVKTISA